MYIKEYLSKYQNEVLTKDNFNDVDLALLSQLPLFDVENIFPKDKSFITFGKAISNHIKLHLFNRLSLIYPRNIVYTILDASHCARYKNIQVGNVYCLIDNSIPTQSVCIEVKLDEENSIIIFGSTDDSIAGWKENFNMLLMDPVPCLTNTLEYTNKLSVDKNYYFVGHSKGGMEALYCGTLCNENIASKVKRIVCFDSPGFSRETFKKIRSSKNFSLLTFYGGENSSVHNILYQDVDKNLVPSSAVGLFQHNLITWEIVDNKFKTIKENKIKKDHVANRVNTAYEDVNKDSYKLFVKTLFGIFEAGGGKTLNSIKSHKTASTMDFILSPWKEKMNVISFMLFLINERIVPKSVFKNFLLVGKSAKKYYFQIYLKKYGQELITKENASNVDYALLSFIPFFDDNGIMPSEDYIPYKDLLRKYLEVHHDKKISFVTPKSIKKDIVKTLDYDRYTNLKIGNYYKYKSEEEETCSSYCEAILDNETSIIIAGSLDDSIIAWQEAYNQMFDKNPPSFEHALYYFNNRINPNKKLIVIGLSKGGTNLLYAITHCKPEIQKNIIEVVTFDHPGFTEEMANEIKASPLMSLVKSYSSQRPVCFDLFHQPLNAYHAVSKAYGCFKHNPLSWKIKDREFYIDESKYKITDFDRKTNLLYKHMSEEKLLLVKRLIFEIFRSSRKDNLLGFYHRLWRPLIYFLLLPRSEKKICYMYLNFVFGGKPMTKKMRKYLLDE